MPVTFAAGSRRIHQLINSVEDERLKPSPDFQRRLVWNDSHKSNFIETILLGLPFPEIYVSQGSVDPNTAESIEWLVDGQQRIMTIFQYFKGTTEIKLKKDVPQYKTLSKDEKGDFLEYIVAVRDLGNLPLKDVREIFKRINSTSYSLNAMEIQNSRYEGAFKAYGERVAKHHIFVDHQIFKPAEIKRMNDLRFILTLTATCLSNYFAKDNKTEQFLRMYNDEFEMADTMYKKLTFVFSYIMSCRFKTKSRVWLKADFFTLVVECFRTIDSKKQMPDPQVFGRKFSGFLDRVAAEITTPNSLPKDYVHLTEARDYVKFVSANTNDRTTRIERGKIVKNFLAHL